MKGTLSHFFKLGQEGKYRVYHNQYSSNALALNKHQHREASGSFTFCLSPLTVHKYIFNCGAHGGSEDDTVASQQGGVHLFARVFVHITETSKSDRLDSLNCRYE